MKTCREEKLRGEKKISFRSLLFFSSRLRRDLFSTIGNQVFRHDGCNRFPGLSNIKSNNTFLNSDRQSDVEAQVEFSFNVRKGLGSPVIDVRVKKDSLLVDLLNFFFIDLYILR